MSLEGVCNLYEFVWVYLNDVEIDVLKYVLFVMLYLWIE